jgi:hypothetical protein
LWNDIERIYTGERLSTSCSVSFMKIMSVFNYTMAFEPDMTGNEIAGILIMRDRLY